VYEVGLKAYCRCGYSGHFLGTVPNPIITSSTPQLKTSKWALSWWTSEDARRWVWAGGNIISRGAIVISVMGEVKIAAADMNEWLKKNGKWEEKLGIASF
jgi:glutamate synthase (NADPH/NADH) small chain